MKREKVLPFLQYHHCLHFTDEETAGQYLPKVTQVGCGGRGLPPNTLSTGKNCVYKAVGAQGKESSGVSPLRKGP